MAYTKGRIILIKERIVVKTSNECYHWKYLNSLLNLIKSLTVCLVLITVEEAAAKYGVRFCRFSIQDV